MKKILKVVYICFGVLLCLLVYMMSYQANYSENILGITNAAIEKENPKDAITSICKVFTSSFYGELAETIDTPNVKGGMVQSATVNEYTTYKKDGDNYTTDTTVNELDNAYILILYKFNEFGTTTLTDSTNSFGLKFSNGDNAYTYYLNVSSSVNKDFYTEKPTNASDAILNIERSTDQYVESFQFVPLIISNTMTNLIKKKIGLANDANFTKIELVDNRGDSKYTFTNNFNFEGEFFNATSDVRTKYNDYYRLANNKDSSDELKKTASEEYSKANEVFQEMISKEGSGYELRYDNSILKPASLIWKAIGVCALFVLCGAILYILLFHFALIKNLVTRHGANNNERHTSYLKKDKVEKTEKTEDSKSKELKFDVIDIRAEEVAQEVKEDNEKTE